MQNSSLAYSHPALHSHNVSTWLTSFGSLVEVERKVDTEANLQHLPKAALTKVKEEDPLCPPPPYHGANAEAAVTPNVKTINAQT